MKPGVWTYENDTYRGKVYLYRGHVRSVIPCKVVRKNRLKAIEDAQKLIRNLKKVVK